MQSMLGSADPFWFQEFERLQKRERERERDKERERERERENKT